MSPPPLVSCLMPTADRRRFVPQAIAYFLRQDYPARELVILDDGPDPVGDLVPGDPRIRYERLSRRPSLGEKRNLAVEHARGDILLHWDDDDWFSSDRVRRQVDALLGAGAEMAGLDRLWFFDPLRRAAWEYIYPPHGPPWAAGGSLCYLREYWRAHPFPPMGVGEDSRFVWAKRGVRLHLMADNSFYAALNHDHNTSPRRPHDSRFQARDYRLLATRLGDDLAFYENRPLDRTAAPMTPTRPTFSLCYTSRRPASIAPVIRQWRERAAQPDDLEVVIAIDADDSASAAAAHDVPGAQVIVQSTAPFNCVRGWNAAAAAARGRVLLAIADDIEPPPQWDHALRGLAPGWMERETVVLTEDGLYRTECHLGIVSRPRYERLGYLFFPGYESMYCDVDMAEHARRDGVLLDARPRLVFQHHHSTNGRRVADAVDAAHSSPGRYGNGAALIRQRRAAGFAPPAPAAAVTTPAPAPVDPGFAAYLQVVRDDFCLSEVLGRLYEEGVRAFFVCVPDQHWSGSATPESDIAGVQAAANRLREMPRTRVEFALFPVAPHRQARSTRVAVETAVRNAALAWVRGQGFRHCLVVDDDELWRRGLLRRLEEFVLARRPGAVACQMTPVAGVPGWPIGHNRDQITIYLDLERGNFRSCRSPAAPSLILPVNGVIHFTAVKRTREELIAKMRDSGHYDDPSYDFEGWIHHTLPRLQPGSRNAHMYRPMQIWPEVRTWTPEEIADIPDSLHPYLGGMPVPA
ncbi:MAG TPA: glycosyltransferase family A protein, partial [Lacunisphaera sp.]|nr:glycosyltransferase family A protein [Lacunisphaera sp.]